MATTTTAAAPSNTFDFSNYSSNVIALDIETTGLPQTNGWNKYHPPEAVHYYDTSRVVSVAFTNGQNETHYSLIKPDDFLIKNTAFHGISHYQAEQEGVTLQIFFSDAVKAAIANADAIVAHNVKFDTNVLAAECIRQGLVEEAALIMNKQWTCTAALGREYYNMRMFPKLSALHYRLFQTIVNVKWHDALEDARACLACYRAMTNNKVPVLRSTTNS
jgi:DNA polymerase III epsilon subunit-like protein